MKPLQVDPEALRAAGDGIDAAVSHVDRIVDDLAAQDAALGEPWGTDDLGFLIGECFIGGFERAFEVLDGNAGALTDYAGRLRAMASAYEQADADGDQRMREIMGRLGEWT